MKKNALISFTPLELRLLIDLILSSNVFTRSSGYATAGDEGLYRMLLVRFSYYLLKGSKENENK